MGFIDITGQRFNRLIVVKYVGKDKSGHSLWLCRCDCGTEKIIHGGHMKSGLIKSCGCLQKEITIQRNKTTGYLKKNCWTKKEDHILSQFYPYKGSEYCTTLLNRTRYSILHRVAQLKLEPKISKTTRLPLKYIINKLSNTCVLSTCKIHGETEHYYNKNKIQNCLKCRQIKSIKKYKENPIHRFSICLRSSIRHAFKKINNKDGGAFKHLPYTQLDLFNHLENIRKLQENKCPECNNNYEKCCMTIEHTIPISKAKTKEEIINLCGLWNLSLMCKLCNSSKKAKDYNTWLKEKKHEF